jgi:hypothetical protein
VDDLGAIADSLEACGLERTPPIVLLTRWRALLVGEDTVFLDAAYDAGPAVPGTRFEFVAVSATAVCYLRAEHDDEYWGQFQHETNPPLQHVTPRTITTWRRPLTSVSEVALGGDPWHWMPPPKGRADTLVPIFRLTVGTDSIEVPLAAPKRRGTVPTPAPPSVT